MAAIDFPNPATQTPVNTFSPTSTPSATANGVTYTWDGEKWVAQVAGGGSQWTTTGSDIYYDTGKVGIGTTSPAGPLEIKFSGNNSGLFITADDNVSWGYSPNIFFRTELTNGGGIGTSGRISSIYESSNSFGMSFYTTSAGSNIERMRITNNGNTWLGTTSSLASGDHKLQIYTNNSAGDSGIVIRQRDATGAGQVYAQKFQNNSGTEVGSIKVTSSSTAFVTSSDYRLKENVLPLAGAADRLKRLPVHRFNFITNPDHTVDGFLAHEAQAVVPECVTGTKDEVDDEGNPVYQGIDQSKLVPLLTAALQEALTEIEDLKTRLTALEAN